MIRIGTSGYNYPEWRGSFYPEKFPAGKMLPYYAERFNHEAWLCPALLKYFGQPPKNLYVQCKAKPHDA